jgi:DNA-binding NtrC family response regulator
LRILVVDDDPGVLKGITGFLGLRGHEPIGAKSYDEGLAAFKREKPDVLILDVYLAGKSGTELLARIMESEPGSRIVMVSGHADLKTAVEAVRAGAYDFFEKPIDTERLETILRNIEGEKALTRKVEGLEKAWLAENVVLGSSPSMVAAAQLAERAGPSDISVLIQGPSGTGKELFARYIRLRSKRAAGPFLTMNCSAIPSELFESELFGSKRGAFTGASADRPGYFRAASGGTLFLDEIGELPLHLQPKILRAIEYGEIQPVGASSSERTDVRILAATNRDLEKDASDGKFRLDLYYRLAQVTIKIPPLSERKEDISLLASFFLDEIEAKAGHSPRKFSEEGLDYLSRREWRGNVRELRNLVERVAILSEGNPIGRVALESVDSGSGSKSGKADPMEPFTAAVGELSLSEAKQEFEKRYIAAVLARAGSVRAAAAVLDLLPNNLSRLISKLGISRNRSTEETRN